MKQTQYAHAYFPGPMTPPGWEPSGENFAYLFSPKERQILDGVLAGYTNEQIGKALNTTRGVVTNWMRGIYDKSGMSNRVELALWWLEHGYRRQVLSIQRKGD